MGESMCDDTGMITGEAVLQVMNVEKNVEVDGLGF
jgi:hypothetical protein